MVVICLFFNGALFCLGIMALQFKIKETTVSTPGGGVRFHTFSSVKLSFGGGGRFHKLGSVNCFVFQYLSLQSNLKHGLVLGGHFLWEDSWGG